VTSLYPDRQLRWRSVATAQTPPRADSGLSADGQTSPAVPVRCRSPCNSGVELRAMAALCLREAPAFCAMPRAMTSRLGTCAGVWSNREHVSYSACQIGPSASHRFQWAWGPRRSTPERSGQGAKKSRGFSALESLLWNTATPRSWPRAGVSRMMASNQMCAPSRLPHHPRTCPLLQMTLYPRALGGSLKPSWIPETLMPLGDL
jgi:hypothetical protein